MDSTGILEVTSVGLGDRSDVECIFIHSSVFFQ